MEIISAELQPSDSPPFYCMSGGQGEGRREREGKREAKGSEGEEWSVRWRSAVRGREGSPVALPVPPSFKQHFASLKTLLKLPVRQLVPLHRYLLHFQQHLLRFQLRWASAGVTLL